MFPYITKNILIDVNLVIFNFVSCLPNRPLSGNLNVATSNNISDRLIKTYGRCHADIAYELQLY